MKMEARIEVLKELKECWQLEQKSKRQRPFFYLGGLDSHVNVGFERMTSSVHVQYDVMPSDEVQTFVNKPVKWAFQVCLKLVNISHILTLTFR